MWPIYFTLGYRFNVQIYRYSNVNWHLKTSRQWLTFTFVCSTGHTRRQNDAVNLAPTVAMATQCASVDFLKTESEIPPDLSWTKRLKTLWPIELTRLQARTFCWRKKKSVQMFSTTWSGHYHMSFWPPCSVVEHLVDEVLVQLASASLTWPSLKGSANSWHFCRYQSRLE